MPLFLDSSGAIADWLRTQGPSLHTDRGLSAAAVPLVAAKVQSECRRKLFTTSNTKIVHILNLFAKSSAIEDERKRDHLVHHRNVEARSSEARPATWDQLADWILREIPTQSNRAREIELAMVVAKSPVILGTINTTIIGIEKLMMIVRLSRGASLSTVRPVPGAAGAGPPPLKRPGAPADPPKGKVAPLDYDVNLLAITAGNPSAKMYLPWTQHKSVGAALGESGAGFTIRAALLHDLMEFSVSMFKSTEVQKLFGYVSPPTDNAETVTTAAGIEKRDNPLQSLVERSEVTEASVQYAKSLHCPVECGPSYTTTRLLRLPTIISTLTSKELDPPSKPVFDPIRKHSSVRVVPHAPGYLRLSSKQQGDIAWAIFGWWTLNFPKHWGTGAHCFFEVSDAARSCGAEIVPKPGVYPTRDWLCNRLQVTWTSADTAELKARVGRLNAGLEQASLPA